MSGDNKDKVKRTPEELSTLLQKLTTPVISQCKLCNVQFGSSVDGDAHYKGRRHKKAEKKLQEENVVGVVEDPATTAATTTSKKRKSGAETSQPSGKKQKLSAQVESGLCYVCNVKLESESTARDHFAGQRHIKNLAKYRKEGNFDDLASSGFGIGQLFKM